MFSWFRKKPAQKQQQEPQDARSTIERITSPACSKDEFVLLYAKLLEERRPGVKILLVEPMTLEMTLPNEEKASTFLDNLWIQWQRSEDRKELVEKHIGAMLSLLKPKQPIERRQIIPIVKDSFFIQQYGERMISEHLVADLYCVCAVDWEDRTQSLSPDNMKEMGLEQGELRELALENLRALLPPAEYFGEGPSYLLSAGTDYVASLLLFDNLWDQLAEMVAGDPVAVVPARDTLLFTGSESKEGIATIRRQAEEIVNGGDHLVSSTLLRRNGGVWKAFS